ncbi:MAG: AarF/ABC1/UbiB kinase family protein, partial [Deltaproteobacteria bacterium]|nr:AarF/ABC1/UbiB kinase family protein [Deltaproteobacteria bacterium]
DASMTTQILLQLTNWDESPDVRALERDVADYIGRYFYRPIKEIELGKSLKQLIELVSRYQLRIPPDFFLMNKVFATLEGVARQLDPDFDMVAQAKPFVAQVKLERYSPRRIAQDAMNAGALLIRFAENLPKELLEILHLARKQQLKLTVTHKELPDMLATHDQISNRIAFSIIIAALIIGSALIVISKTPPIIYGISLIGIIGFFAAAIMGVWLLVAILKKGKL